MVNSKARRRRRLRLRDGDNCFYCGKAMRFEPPPNHQGPNWTSGDQATIEHLLDRKYGGTDELTNLVLAHRKCNNIRGPMTLEEKLRGRVCQPELTRRQRKRLRWRLTQADATVKG